MNKPNDIQSLIQQGENTQIEFKSAAARPKIIAREIVAFANTLGGSSKNVGCMPKVFSGTMLKSTLATQIAKFTGK